MRRFALAAAIAALGVAAGASSAAAAPANPRLADVRTFAFGLGLDVDATVAAQLAPYDLVIVDGETDPAAVAQLKANGSVVLGYLSVGTLEPYRPWYKKLKRYALDDRFDEFDEDYARVSAKGFRKAISRRIAPRTLDRGFDGLFLDNVDMVELHRKQRGGMRKLVAARGALVDGRGGLLFAQNGESVLAPFVPYLDGWNREDVTWTYSFKRKRYVHNSAAEVQDRLAALRSVAALGLLVTATDYTAPGDTAAEAEAIANSCASGAIPFVSDIALRRLPAQPFTCG